MSSVTESMAHGDFIPAYSIELGGEEWDIGVYRDKDMFSPADYAAALPQNRAYALTLDVHLLTADGKIEESSLQKWRPGISQAQHDYPEEKVPEGLVARLEALANEHRLFGHAKPNTKNAPKTGLSHVVRINGQRWGVGPMEAGGGFAVRAWGLKPEGGRKMVEQYPALMDENGIAAGYYRVREMDGRSQTPWRDATPKDGVPARLLEEMLRTANNQKHFGSLPELESKSMQEQFEQSFAERERERQAAATKNGRGFSA